MKEQQQRDAFMQATGKDIHCSAARTAYLKANPPKASEISLAIAYPEINGQSAWHRSPHEAGSADRYYGRPHRPNFSFMGVHFSEAEMTEEQRRQYDTGFWNEQDRKHQWQRPRRDYDGEDGE